MILSLLVQKKRGARCFSHEFAYLPHLCAFQYVRQHGVLQFINKYQVSFL